MGWRDWFAGRTPLQLALERGLAPDGDLGSEIYKLGEFQISSGDDAEAICTALDQLKRQPRKKDAHQFRSPLCDLIGLFQRVDGGDCRAFGVFVDQGLPLLEQIVDEALANPESADQDDVLLALKILAMFGTPGGADAVIEAARQAIYPDAYLWSVILAAYRPDHPEVDRLFAAFADQLPPGFLGVALLDAANAARLEGGDDIQHPFDSRAGVERLEQYLTASDPERFSYAVSATAALPFIHQPQRDGLLALALDHPDANVQLEAAWAAAKLGREAGFKCLARCCLDVRQAERAMTYLGELHREDLIPAAARDPDFRAKAEFAQWLAHPSELGRMPDELTIIDRRELAWPPDRARRPFWLIRYRVRKQSPLEDDDVDVGLVGSVTFCLFTYQLYQRPPEDCYAIHCYWEMQGAGLISDMAVSASSDEYDGLLDQWTGALLEDARMTHVAELSSQLGYPQALVGLATAERAGEAGWVVLDGPRSRWYPRSTMPADAPAQTVLHLHVGRVLLGFHDEPDRPRFLKAAPPPHSADDVIAAYESLLQDSVRQNLGKPEKERELPALLGDRFELYVAALVERRGGARPQHVACAFEKLWQAAREIDPNGSSRVRDNFGPLGKTLDAYVDALIALGRNVEVPEVLARFEPCWNHNLGYGRLGAAAFRAGAFALADRLLTTLHQSYRDVHRSQDMDLLAEVWRRQGRIADARDLLLDCLRRVSQEARAMSGTERDHFENIFQRHRDTFLRLFPEDGARQLEQAGIPATTVAT